MRCPDCGASNPERAEWCGQCYASLRADPEPARAVESPAQAPVSDTPGPDASDGAGLPPPPGTDAEDERLARRGLRKVGGELEWECVSCEAFNPMERTACATCGTAFTARFDTAEEEPERDWRAALLLTVLLPGVGHWTVGHQGSGVARAVLYTIWLSGGLLLLLGGAGAGAVAVPLLLGAVVIWAGSIIDVLRLQAGDSELLAGRLLLWLVVGVTVLVVVGAVAGAAGVR